ncbi:MAG: photosystem reaction center subunit [Verrucomicrobiales bacterium]|nr:photosystem reaction center subunit [Verrucomicrobiales bacterium]
MLRSVNHLRGFRLGALDGEIGHAREIYFDDHTWRVRYLVADVGHWLPGRKVLIPPHALGTIDEREKIFHVQLTMQQVEKSPPIDSDKPLSRQLEEEYLRYFGWPFYWMDPIFWSVPTGGGVGLFPPADSSSPPKQTDQHLRSSREVKGYHLHARDGDIGHVDDFLVDDADWKIRDLIVGTRNWLPGKKVLIPTEWIQKVSWEESKVLVDVPRDLLRELPPYYESGKEAEILETIGRMPPFPP